MWKVKNCGLCLANLFPFNLVFDIYINEKHPQFLRYRTY